MSTGTRVTLAFSTPETCPLASFSNRHECVIDHVSTSVNTASSPGGVTEFLAQTGEQVADELVPVFSYGDRTLYRFEHNPEPQCPCEWIGSHDCAIHRYGVDDGELVLVFHASTFDTVQEVMDDLRREFPSLDVRRLLQPPLEGSPEEQVLVNRGKLTNRQRRALETAYDMGYFERPKGANATEVAEQLGIAQSTFTEHLMVAQQKLLGDILER